MEFLTDILYHNLKELISYVSFYLVSLVVFHFLSKNKQKRDLVLNSLNIIRIVLSEKLGDKANSVLAIWIDGLRKVQDGEFSHDDKVDQFLRYIKLAASQKGISLSESDVEILHTLIIGSFVNVPTEKPEIVTQSINKFSTESKF